MTAHEPDEFDLELELAGEPLDPEVARALGADRSLDPARAEIEALRGWWEHYRPPLPVPPPPRRRSWAWLAPIAAIAAVVLVMVAWPRDPGYTPRGVPEVDVWRTRAGAPVDSTAPFQGGDRLGLALVLDRTAYVTVAALQEDGRVSPLVTGREVRSGARFQVPGAVALDGYSGREWVVVLATPAPLAEEQLVQQVDALLPTPRSGPGRWVIEVTRGPR